jgi:hypothetical protein
MTRPRLIVEPTTDTALFRGYLAIRPTRCFSDLKRVLETPIRRSETVLETDTD